MQRQNAFPVNRTSTNRESRFWLYHSRGALRANRLFQAREPGFLQPLSQSGHDLSRQARSFINQTGVDLYQRRAGGDLVPGIIGVEDAAHADDWQQALCPSINVSDNLRAALSQWTAAQTAFLGVNQFQFRVRSG